MVSKEIKYRNKVLAMVVWDAEFRHGTEFFSRHNYSQQIARIKRQRGCVILPHAHNEIKRTIYRTQEVLYVKSGFVAIDIYNQLRCLINTVYLRQGDMIHLISGGHGVSFLETSELIEVKQGPYAGRKDKTVYPCL